MCRFRAALSPPLSHPSVARITKSGQKTGAREHCMAPRKSLWAEGLLCLMLLLPERQVLSTLGKATFTLSPHQYFPPWAPVISEDFSYEKNKFPSRVTPSVSDFKHLW